MEEKIHAMFVDKNYKFLYYKEFTLREDIDVGDGKRCYKCYNDSTEKGYYQMICERYWSSWIFKGGEEGYIFLSKNVNDLFVEWKCGNVQR